jgi:hypothetical protein
MNIFLLIVLLIVCLVINLAGAEWESPVSRWNALKTTSALKSG